MRDMKITIEFLTPCLVLSKIDRKTNCEYFDRDSHGDIIWNSGWWRSAINKTVDMFDIESLSSQDFTWALPVKCTTDKHKVKCHGKRHIRYRKHECIPVGVPVTFEAAVSDTVDEADAEDLFTRVGKYVGMSPYGYKLGYGKFIVLSINIT